MNEGRLTALAILPMQPSIQRVYRNICEIPHFHDLATEKNISNKNSLEFLFKQ